MDAFEKNHSRGDAKRKVKTSLFKPWLFMNLPSMESHSMTSYSRILLAMACKACKAGAMWLLFNIGTFLWAFLRCIHSLYGIHMILGIFLVGVAMKLGSEGSVGGRFISPPPTAVSTFNFPNARALVLQPAGNTLKLRVLVAEGTPDRAIKYLDVGPEVNALAERMRLGTTASDLIEMPYLPTGNWSAAYVGVASNDEQTELTNKIWLPLSGVENTWHKASYEYLDLSFLSMEGNRTHVMLVSHPSLNTPKHLAVLKYALFPEDIPSIERETAIYSHLKKCRSAPKFLGHVTEHGRVIGFLIEHIESARPANSESIFSDLAREKCKAAMVDLHRFGIRHNDAHAGNCLLRKDGTAVWVDFDLAEQVPVQVDPSDVPALDVPRLNVPKLDVRRSAVPPSAAPQTDIPPLDAPRSDIPVVYTQVGRQSAQGHI
ncbi:hypothetical protein GGR50DRAFT_666466 [Xylaria sp. CBS 124048]|nr:hypothetical protein GGR50DRAFT_666466 [Xylaria sp. CBS 124048]